MTWTRPDLATPYRRSFVLAVLAAAAGSAALAIALVEPPAAPVVTTIPIPPAAVTIRVPPAAPPQVTVTAPAPAPAPVPEPAPAPEPPRPRALAPAIVADCYGPRHEGASLPDACSWDDGFPAISGDGSRIAMKVSVGNPHLVDEATGMGTEIQLLDTRTGRVVRRLVVAEATAYDAEREAAQRRTALRRAAAAQRVLDDGRYRSLVPLGRNDAYHQHVEVDATKIHAEFSEAYVRIVDPATSTVIGQHDFAVPPPKPASPDDDCSAWRLRSLELVWDPPTKTVVATSTYDEGGCMCDTVPFVAIERLR